MNVIRLPAQIVIEDSVSKNYITFDSDIEFDKDKTAYNSSVSILSPNPSLYRRKAKRNLLARTIEHHGSNTKNEHGFLEIPGYSVGVFLQKRTPELEADATLGFYVGRADKAEKVLQDHFQQYLRGESIDLDESWDIMGGSDIWNAWRDGLNEISRQGPIIKKQTLLYLPSSQ